jgi:hypothetical protein
MKLSQAAAQLESLEQKLAWLLWQVCWLKLQVSPQTQVDAPQPQLT